MVFGGEIQVGRRLAGLPRPSLLTAALVAAAVSLGWLAVRYAYPFGPPVLGWLLVPITPLLAAIATGRVARDPAMPKAARDLWRAMTYGTVLTFCSSFTTAYHHLSATGAAAVQRADTLSFALFLAAAFVTLWGVMRLPVRRRRFSEWLTVGLDIGIVLVASGLIMAYATRHSALSDQFLWAIGITAAVGVLVAIKVSLTGFTGLNPAAMRVLAGTVLLGSLTGGLSPPAGRLDLNQAMVALPLVYAGFAYAAELQRRPKVRRVAARRRPIPFSVLPYVAIGCTDLLLLVADHGNGALDPLVTGSVVLTGIVIIRQIVSFAENRRYQDRLAYQATHDDLTGLANRALFTDLTEDALTDAPAGTVTVALIDLDDFKSINDRLGHDVGDQLLLALGTRLGGAVRPQDTIARLGGDEFAILLTGGSLDDPAAIATRVLALLAVPVSTGDHDLLVQASIGLADNTAASTAADLLRHADIAMYAAKARGRNRYAHFNADLDAQTVEHAQLAADLSHAVTDNQLRLLYQPIVELPTARLVGVEALVRWHHPRHGLVSPDRFIPVAEQTGQIVPIGAWILATACQQAIAWDRTLGARAPYRITVNVSGRQLLDPEFPQHVATVLADTGLHPARLTIEITETAVFGGGPTVDAVTTIRAAGVAIALDDFGTGHSSLGLLRTCPVDIVKVDKSFVDGIGGTLRDEAIATSVLHIADALGLRTIAEGVETSAQATRLYELGYHLAQGFHFARPLPPHEIEPFIDTPTHAAAPATTG